MKRNELMKELKSMNVKFSATMKTIDLEKLYNENIKESEKKTMKTEEKKNSFDTLKNMLANIENCYIINETDRRLTTNKVMFCKRANNKVRAYLKLKTNDSLACEKNTQYKANVLVDLNDSYAIYTLKRLYAR